MKLFRITLIYIFIRNDLYTTYCTKYSSNLFLNILSSSIIIDLQFLPLLQEFSTISYTINIDNTCIVVVIILFPRPLLPISSLDHPIITTHFITSSTVITTGSIPITTFFSLLHPSCSGTGNICTFR